MPVKKNILELLYNQIRIEKSIKNLKAPPFPFYIMKKQEKKMGSYRDLAHLAFQLSKSR